MLEAFDIAVGILVLVSALLATTRGFTREVLSLVTWAGAAALAVYAWQFHGDIARQYVADETIADIATILVVFIIALVILHLITMRIADFIVDSKLGPIDRTLGFLFGALRGIVMATVVVIFATWLMPSSLPGWFANALSLPYLENFGDTLISLLPQNLEEQLNDFLSGSGRADAEPQEIPTSQPRAGGEGGPIDDLAAI